VGVTVAGFAWSIELAVDAEDFDAQGHFNNAAIVRHFNDLRVAYVRTNLGPDWINWLQSSGAVVLAREVHVSYESEGLPHELYVGSTRITRRDGRAAIIEQRIGELDTGRTIANAWVVQLLGLDGRAIDWPDFYWPLVERAEARSIPHRPSVPRLPFGPPAWNDE
jgi:acyl-CoA thioesterase FadM